MSSALIPQPKIILEGTHLTELSRSLLNLAERDGTASYPQFTALQGIPT
jgi:hypothetical protein